jgi:hypothetical protein
MEKGGMVVVEVRVQTVCTKEIPVVLKGKEMYVDPFTLVLQSAPTPVSCQKGAPPPPDVREKENRCVGILC